MSALASFLLFHAGSQLWTELPPELLNLITSQLPQSELPSVRLVCKAWATQLLQYVTQAHVKADLSQGGAQVLARLAPTHLSASVQQLVPVPPAYLDAGHSLDPEWKDKSGRVRAPQCPQPPTAAQTDRLSAAAGCQAGRYQSDHTAGYMGCKGRRPGHEAESSPPAASPPWAAKLVAASASKMVCQRLHCSDSPAVIVTAAQSLPVCSVHIRPPRPAASGRAPQPEGSHALPPQLGHSAAHHAADKAGGSQSCGHHH